MNPLPRSRRGSALVTIVILTTVISVTAAVLLKYSMSEFRLNQRNILRFQAKGAAEAMLEYGSAELVARISRSVNFANDELTTNPLATPAARKSGLMTQGTGYTSNVTPSSMRFWASQLSDNTRRLIDPGDPGNDFDPLRGQYAGTKIMRLLATATATAGGVSATAHATETIEIRDAFIFNYAIFYNIPMEFHPGANMTIAGPVHSNKDSRISADSTLTFQNSVTTAGQLIAGPFSNAGPGRPTGKNVRYATGLDLNVDGVPDTIAIDATIRGYNGSNLNTYVDSSLASRSAGNTFAAIASQVWRGNLQDSSMGIVPQNLPAIEAASTTQAHDIIEPKDSSVTSSSSADVRSREAQKFANKAGLYIFQGAPVSGTAPAPIAFKSATDAATYKALNATQRNTWATTTANKSKLVKLPANAVKNTRRMTDFRENTRVVNMVDIDVGKLRTAVNTTTSGVATNLKTWDGSGTEIDWNLDATTNGWNGQVYVEVENPNAGFTATSDVGSMGSGTGTRTAVRLVNGATLPNRKAINSDAVEGLSVATNAPVYIVGNYNSPGLNAGTRNGTAVGTENIATIDVPKDGEVPAAIVADAVNVLSTAWWDGSKPSGDEDSSSTNKANRRAKNTEICAAFLTGNVATSGSGNSNDNYSGGVENFIRLHESWSVSNNKTLRYRGSMVALFNSEVATGQWADASYDAPTREWGFNRRFGSEGRYPPGTPMIRTFRRLDYRDLSKAQFDAMLATTAYAFTEM